ncbi:two-component sensor histidine kinase [Chryseobacterium vietnamense]|uniref:Two-component sensor histidine kinase n=1 Tax=Chryseobacterium vietnamense TaxID=866785 RepID=A0ACC6JBX6_9FLAO|nr:sensor histidine kinase [Chryseobacterium vietnamense]MDR6460364.1 two-component sensor histidine kinase [Chryseobacterium vietnamense]
MMMKTTSETQIRHNLYFQLLFWTALFLFGTVKMYGEYNNEVSKGLIIYNFCHWIFQIAGANFIYFVLIRHFFDQKKYIELILSILLSLYIISVINRFFIVYIAEPLFINELKDTPFEILTDIPYLLLHYTFPIISGAFIFISIMFIIRYKDEKEHSIKLQKEKMELELQSLKSQLNPHFLFNTLNNIYSLSISHSDKTSQSISQLSDILDYILYKGQKKWVQASDELEIIDHYIALESLRYHEERLRIQKFSKINSHNTIPPLLYLTLVENAFKHGAGNNSATTEIKIAIETNHQHSVFTIENTFSDHQTNNEKGIGLQNIKRQLQYHYQEHFTFRISQENNIFKVEITTPSHYD